jgi:hypothetical protein
MVIDLSDDDEPTQSQQPAKPEFEDGDEEIDPSHPYHDILRTLEIPLGAASLSLAFPNVPNSISSTSCPSLLKDHVVAAVACSDLSMRIVVIPLTPPPPEQIDASAIGVQILRVAGNGFHQDLLTAIALTFTGDLDDSREETGARKWSLLVASTSCTGRGLLLIHQIPINGNRLSADASDLLPVRREYVRASMMAARLTFNTSPFPDERHSTLLITVPEASCVKLYQVFKRQTHGRNRRGSVGTTDSVSSTRSNPNLSANSGKFLISLLPEYPLTDSFDLTHRRKSVLDAKWVLGGKAVVALLEDGEWGVWDLEAAGPAAPSNSNLIKGQSNTVGIVGGSFMRFAIKGSITTSATTSRPEKQITASKGLVTATPHTRKVQAQGLFSGSDQAAVSSQTRTGSICVSPLPESPLDESILINYGTQNLHIPSVLGYWKTSAWRKGSLSANTSSSLLPSLRLSDEPIKSISLLPTFTEREEPAFGSRQRANFMVSTSSRLVLFVGPLVDAPEERPVSRGQPITFNIGRTTTDQSLLQQGVLDVDGMDRILDTMESPAQSQVLSRSRSQNQAAFTSNRSSVNPKPNFGRSVAFDHEVDMDLTPVASPATSRQLQLSERKGTERRLFS